MTSTSIPLAAHQGTTPSPPAEERILWFSMGSRGTGLSSIPAKELSHLLRGIGIRPGRNLAANRALALEWHQQRIEASLQRDATVTFRWMRYTRQDGLCGWVVCIDHSGRYGWWRDDREGRREELATQRDLRAVLRDTSRHFGGSVWKRAKQRETQEPTRPGFHFRRSDDLVRFVEFVIGRAPLTPTPADRERAKLTPQEFIFSEIRSTDQ